MIELFLSKPIWGGDDRTTELSEQRIALYDELEKVIWGVVTSEGRSEARLWLCEAISSLTSIGPREQQELFMSLLRSKPRKWDFAEQVLELVIVERPCEVGAILARKSHRIKSFFQGHPRRMTQWFSTFSIEGNSAHTNGAKALSQFAFINRDICWVELEWKGKHGQSPAVVATKPHYFLDLDIRQTINNFIDNVSEFWSSKEFSDSLKDGDIISIDKRYFINFFLDLMYEDDFKDIWDVIEEFLLEKSFSYLCKHLLIILPEQDLCTLLRKLQHSLSRSKKMNFDEKSYWLDILIRKYSDTDSLDELLLLNGLFNKGRQLLRLVSTEDNLKISDLVLKIYTKTCEGDGLIPISKVNRKSNARVIMKWLGLLSWSLLYRLSKEIHTSESWKAVLGNNEIGFRDSNAYGLLAHDDRCEHKKKEKRRKKRKRNRDVDMFNGDELLELDDKSDFQSSSGSWFLSTDSYSSSWTLADLPEHLSKHCLKEWMKQSFND